MSSNEWKTVSLAEVLELKNGKSRPKQYGDYPVYGGNGVLGYTDKFNVTGETLIIGRVGAYCGATYYENEPSWISDNALYAKAYKGNSTKFFYYLLKGKNLNQFAGGSSHPLLTQGGLNELELNIPTFPCQQKIASILSALDNKIENNLQATRTLEAIARTLFNELCLPKDSELPQGWQVGKLGEILKVTMGQSPSGSSFNHNGDGIIFFQGKAEFGFRFPKIDKYTTEPKKYANKLDTLLSVRAPVGTINMATERCCIGRGLAAISSKYWSFAYYLLDSLSTTFEVFNGEGTVFGSINKTDLENIEVFIPPIAEIEKFERISNEIDLKILASEKENQTLKDIRDSLLPKLMSGAIKVNA
jgi:type I restriction enzyme S subunit